MANPPPPRHRRDFEIAVICALQLEADAVEALFDKFYDRHVYGKARGDTNSYTMGMIDRHNVVLAYMPDIGKGSAASVAASFRYSFEGIKLGLVVGVCGGVPNGTDEEKEILLGDVIISTGLVEYNFGRQFPDKFIRKDTLESNLGRPNAEIRSFLARIKGRTGRMHLKNNTFTSLEALYQIPGFERAQYPGVDEDKLFKPTYRHRHQNLPSCITCTKCENKGDKVCIAALNMSCLELKCDEGKLVPRDRLIRAKESIVAQHPCIHFGKIASGDTVMKSGEDRDEIATKEKVIAFEMEGAGVWDNFPCVVIKGVCDYADSHKNKKWQGYAAATAAACMKAILREWICTGKPWESEIPPESVEPNRLDAVTQQQLKDIRSACLRSLSFSNIDDREHNIAPAHQDTCDWLFETFQFRQWRDREDFQGHNGVLWIKGKPGAGKSTLMKHTLFYCKKTFMDYVIAAYFFNARGSKLEKTPLGMLRSLLYQLLEQDPLLCERFIPIYLEKQMKHGKDWEWQAEELKNFLLYQLLKQDRESQEEELKYFLQSEPKKPQPKPLLILIDALDECDKSEVREVVSFLESLSINSIRAQTSLNVCLSSRHYPNISMKKTLELIVEHDAEHDQDIVRYVQHKLRMTDAEIEQQLLRKASGVFMWVVLVVEMLNKAFDHGEVRAMQKKLREIPSDLDEVFWTLLDKDNQDKQETILMLQWVLFGGRQLKAEELYFAVLAGTEIEELEAWDRSRETGEIIKRWITSISKGLIEIRNSGTVQFIHESVNDFLLRNKRLQTLDPALEPDVIGTSHNRLKACCMSYIMLEGLEPSGKNGVGWCEELAFNYPFLKYASTYVLYHAVEAQKGFIGQQDFVRQLQRPRGKEFQRLGCFLDGFQARPSLRYFINVELFYVLSFYGYHELVQVVLLEKRFDVNAMGGYYGNAVQAASMMGHGKIVSLLLENGADVNAEGGPYGNALQAASMMGHKAVVTLLLENGANVNAQSGHYGNALQAASTRGHKDIIALLLESGADINAQGGYYGNALRAASMMEYKGIVALLRERGANADCLTPRKRRRLT